MRLISKIFALFLITSFFHGCDVVEGPYIESNSGGPDTSNTKVRKVFLEDYTGHTCKNCPEAAVIAKQVADLYPKQVITLAVHAGFFANPEPQPPYDYDFRTPTGEAWDQFFGNSNAGNPNGMVDRMDYSNSDHIKGITAWGSLVSQRLQEPLEAYIVIDSDYNSDNRTANISVDTELFQDLTDPLKLVVLLTEDSIVKPQKDVDQQGNSITIYDYVHMHVLRAAINSTWGDELSASGGSTGTLFENDYSFTLDQEYRADQCHVVAFVYNDLTKEVLQAEYAPIQ